jgi:xylulokinase
MQKLLLGIDIGTSACKVAVFSEDGKVIVQNTGEYKLYYPNPGWVEQDPNEWWDATSTAIKEMFEKSNIQPNDIAGIGIDGQSWSAIPIDNKGEVLDKTPIWMDTRATDICDELREKIGEEEIFALCGNPVQPTYTLPKILWFKKHKPEMYKKIYKVLQSNSFIVYRLTGEISQDLSQGYGLHCFDMKKGTWDDDMCVKMGLDINILPDKIYQCHKIVGTVNKKAAELTGLNIGTPVVAGGLDAACGTLGAGVINSGETQEQGGQAGGMSICMDEYKAEKTLILGYHVVPDRWLLQGGTVGGGGVVRWFEKEFCELERARAKVNDTSSFDEMNIEAEKIEPGSDGLVFLPYMAGERSPIWDKNAKGVFYGLDFSKTRAHMIRSCFEGVAFSLKHNLDAALNAGAKVDALYATGGSANSILWTQIKSDITGKKIIVPSSDTSTMMGAALLAGVGVGVYKDFKDAVIKTVKVTRNHEPDMEKHKKYKKFYDIYIALYNNLKGVMNKKWEDQK